jgi:outer membrane receptor protein involved in Fe transport
LNETIRAQLAAAGETSFTLGKFQTGLLQSTYDGTRTQKEGAIGIDVDLGGSWKIGAHYSHGETLWKQRVPNSIIVSRFNNAINAVSSNGQIVCAINADAVTANDDPACRPYNLFGTYAASPEALAYVRGTQRNDTTYKLDAAAVELTGDLFPLWAEPIAIAAGAEARFEEQKSVSGEPDLAGVYGGLNFYGAPVSGGFNVKEAFGEIAVPVFDISDTAKLDLNGAARYSDYSQSGGIWSWKGGATLNLFNSLLLRGTRSRDIRAPTIGERFATRFINIGALVDQDQAGRAAANPAYNPTPQSVTTYSGGNPDLLPEIGHTTTVGVTFSPKFAPGLSLSVDYYNITIDGQITTLSGGTLTLACSRGNTAACDRITRDATGTVTEVRSNAQNIAKYKQKGVDFDAAYLIPMERISSSIPGSLRIRAIATYVDKAVTDTGASVSDAAGNAFSLPKWRGFASMSYQNDSFGLDLRLRYIGKGKVNTLLDQEFIEATETTAAARTGYLVNNDVPATYYLDLGMQYKLMNKLTLSFNVNNLFDRAPPISTAGPAFHDVVGTYFTFGANVNF